MRAEQNPHAEQHGERCQQNSFQPQAIHKFGRWSLSTENDALSAQVTQLREEVVNLKTLLLAHKDCAVSQAQGLSGMAMNTLIGDINHANPYGMAMQPNGMGMHMGGQGQMPRTYVEYE